MLMSSRSAASSSACSASSRACVTPIRARCDDLIVIVLLAATTRSGSSYPWYRARREQRYRCEREERDADRRDDPLAAAHALLDEHDRAERSHPREMRDAGGEHHEHERPTAAD